MLFIHFTPQPQTPFCHLHGVNENEGVGNCFGLPGVHQLKYTEKLHKAPQNSTLLRRLPPVCAGGTTEDTVDVISSFLINTEYVNAGLVFGNDLQCNLAKESGPKKKEREEVIQKVFFMPK